VKGREEAKAALMTTGGDAFNIMGHGSFHL
jgi:hypothetical protein